MITYLTTATLKANRDLADSMFRDRAAQFRGRLGWPVQVDAEGREMDQYDPLGATYVVWIGEDGLHGGSMRIMPTVKRHMAAEHFAHICGGKIRDPLIWESTRFAIAPGAPRGVASALMMAGQVFGIRRGMTGCLGVYDLPMERVYKRLGCAPTPLGRTGDGRGAIGAGMWSVSMANVEELSRRSGIASHKVLRWHDECYERAVEAA
ncbi:MAG: acyl-homoserine-lactone synthase [Hasllibacter sp.]